MPILTADVRLHWFYGDEVAPVKIGNSVWWVWFHPGFEDIHAGIKLGRSQIDGPHKAKNAARFPDRFGITMLF
eukprot:gene3574-21005_t